MRVADGMKTIRICEPANEAFDVNLLGDVGFNKKNFYRTQRHDGTIPRYSLFLAEKVPENIPEPSGVPASPDMSPMILSSTTLPA